MTKVFFGLVVVIALLGGFVYFASKTQFPEVAEPSATTTPATTTLVRIETGLDSGASALDVTVTPREVLEDSRCPIGVQCVWAGQVRVRADIESGLGTASAHFSVGTTITTEAEAVTLTEVTPSPREGQEIDAETYRFIFEIQKRTL